MDTNKIRSDVEEQICRPFQKPRERARFVRAVYALLTLMLAADAACVAAGLYLPCVRRLLAEHAWPLVAAALAFVALYASLVFCEAARRRAPYNYAMTAAVTLAAGCVMAGVAVRGSREGVLSAAAGTCVVTLSVCLMALCCPCDFTHYFFIIFVGGVSVAVATAALVFAYALSAIGDKGRLLHVGISGAFVFVFALYLAYDTQLVLGGSRHSLQPNEFVLGALHLWIDITLMFLSLLQFSFLTGGGQAPPIAKQDAPLPTASP